MSIWAQWAVCLAAMSAVCIYLLGDNLGDNRGSTHEASELLLKEHMRAVEPYSPPANMYLWWGDTTNHRFVGSGEHIRHLLAMGTIEGGEWRDPMFLGNNGVATFRSQRFRRISESCCSTIVMPPFEWDFPVYNTHKIIGQRLRNYVANGNMLILTGGIMDIEFINTYFYYNMELVDGNYSPGPFRKLPGIPECMRKAPRVLPQKGIAVTAVKKESLPSGAQVLWGTPRSSPVFMIKFCEAQNPSEGMPPIKVLPRDCPASKRAGRPCSCGHILYIGYNYQERYPTRYDQVLRSAVEILNPAKPGGVTKLTQTHENESAEDSGDDEQARDTDEQARDLVSRESLTRVDEGEKHVVARKGHAAADSEVVDQKLAMQRLEMRHLSKMLSTLEDERKAIHKYTEKKDAMPRTSILALLKAKAARLIGEIRREVKDSKEHTSPAEKTTKLNENEPDQSAKSTDGEARKGAKLRRIEDTQHVLMQSIATLAHDVKDIDTRLMDHDEQREGREQGGRGAERERERGDDSRRYARHGAQGGGGGRGRDEMLHERAGRERGGRRGGGWREQLSNAEEKARAYKRELAFEQSVPMPAYTYEERDHAVPLFAKGGAADVPRCGTMCRLKHMVEKTRASITRELNDALK